MERLLQFLCYAIWVPGLFVLETLDRLIPPIRNYTSVYAAPFIGLGLWISIIGLLIWLL